MFSIKSDKRSKRYCDGKSRRNFLQVGALGVGGLTLGGLYRAEADAGLGSSEKAVINIHLAGGPSHQDTFDLKPEAAREFRGEFSPIQTNAPGMDICEHFPLLATSADKFAVVRSLTGSIADHSDYPTQTGFPRSDLQGIGGRPALGSVAARLLGSRRGAPPFIGYNGTYPGYLGAVYKPYRPQGGDLRLSKTMTAERMQSRSELLSSLDCLKREADNSGQMEALDSYTQRAVDVVTSGRVADAIDLGKEDAKIRERYGKDGNMFLTARRLVEAGVLFTCVYMESKGTGHWDSHGRIFPHLKNNLLPVLDRVYPALIQDLEERRLLDSTLVIVMGEMGRTPRVNVEAGRHHWPQCGFSLLTGGGVKQGHIYGKSDNHAGFPVEDKVSGGDIVATIYKLLGVDPQLHVPDLRGRPIHVAHGGRPVDGVIA